MMYLDISEILFAKLCRFLD